MPPNSLVDKDGLETQDASVVFSKVAAVPCNPLVSIRVRRNGTSF